jgi:hypothetical protein
MVAIGGVAIAQTSAPIIRQRAVDTSVSLRSVADAYVTSSAPRLSLEGSDQVQASLEAGHVKRAFVAFRVPDLGGADIVSATLELTRTNHHLSSLVVARAVNRCSWHQRITWSTRPSMGAQLDSVRATVATKVVSLNVRRVVHSGETVTIGISTPSRSNFAAFRSRESGSGEPILRLRLRNYVPDPHETTPVAPSSEPVTSSSSNPGTPSSSSSSDPSTTSTSPSSTSAAPSTSSSDPSSTSAAPSSTSVAPSTSSSNPSSTSAAPSSTSVAPSSTSSSPAGSDCTISAKLVPSCGAWWGIAPKAHTNIPRNVGLPQLEQEGQTKYNLLHDYHENGELFPTAMEKTIAFEPGANRVLLENWKPATDMTWAQVAAGQADARIDAEANYIKTSFPYPFFLAVWHEPENDVIETPGSGMTAADYAAMFRHVVLRLRADGATQPVIVMDYMGFDSYAQFSWFNDLYPGDDVVDWIAIDPYGSGDPTGYRSGDFTKLVNRPDGSFPGYYSWATRSHPGKPIMLAEWGIDESTIDPQGKARYFGTVSSQMYKFPAIKALVYFDYNGPGPNNHPRSTSPDTSTVSLDAWRQLCNWATVNGPDPVYEPGKVANAS